MRMKPGFVPNDRRQTVPKVYEGCTVKAVRPIGFAPWPAVVEWIVWDTETFTDQEDRLREVLALPDDEEDPFGCVETGADR